MMSLAFSSHKKWKIYHLEHSYKYECEFGDDGYSGVDSYFPARKEILHDDDIDSLQGYHERYDRECIPERMYRLSLL
jgi:hypothetical protein